MPQDDAAKATPPPLTSPSEVIRCAMARNGWNAPTSAAASLAVIADLAAAGFSIVATHHVEDKDGALAMYREDTEQLRNDVGRYRGQAAGLSERCAQLRGQ